MAKKTPKIVLYKEGVSGQDLAEASVKSAEVVDAVSIMQTDFVPEEKTVQLNKEGGFFCAELTESEAKSIADQSDVVDVVDDIEVYALDDSPPGMDDGDGGLDGLEDPISLELDPDDVEALEADPYPELEAGEELLSGEQLRLLTQLEPELGTDAEIERQLVEGAAGDLAQTPELQALPRENVPKLIRCLLRCLAESGGEAKEVDPQQIDKALGESGLAADPVVRAAADYILWNLWMIFAPWAWRYSTGAGVRAAVVDTGIGRRHSDLHVWGGVSYVPGVASYQDDHGHGTHVAGTIAALRNRQGIIGVAPSARLYAVKVLNRYGRGRLSWILNGLMWCYHTRMHVVNLSLGSRATSHDPRVFNAAYEHVGRRLRSRGILAVAAAGNDYHRPVSDPARCPSYLAVSALDRRRRLTTFTNVGPQVELCAPGQGILSTWRGGGYRSLNGTSMACPHVTGVAALVKARRPAWHGDRIRVHLWRTALDLGSPGRDWAFGYGQVHTWRAVR